MRDVVTHAAGLGIQSRLLPRVLAAAPQERGATARTEPARDDLLELSDAARDFDDAQAGRVREALVERVRGEIESDTYLTPEKLEIAINRLWNDRFRT